MPWQALFEFYLTTPMADTVPLPPVALPTLLTRNDNPQIPLVIAQQRAIERTAIDEARDLIDSGCLEDAQILLESAVERQSDSDPGLHEELLALYRATRAGEALALCYQRIESRLSPSLRQQWQTTQNAIERLTDS